MAQSKQKLKVFKWTASDKKNEPVFPSVQETKAVDLQRALQRVAAALPEPDDDITTIVIWRPTEAK